MSLRDYRALVLQQTYPGAAIDYAPVRDTWFVLSGTRDGTMFYERVTFTCGGRRINSWAMLYPTTERQVYDRIVEQVARSYRPGAATADDAFPEAVGCSGLTDFDGGAHEFWAREITRIGMWWRHTRFVGRMGGSAERMNTLPTHPQQDAVYSSHSPASKLVAEGDGLDAGSMCTPMLPIVTLSPAVISRSERSTSLLTTVRT